MSTRGKITEIYDLSAIEQQQDKVVAMLNSTIKAINEFPKAKIDLGGAGKTKEVIDGMNKINDITSKVSNSLNNTATAYDELIEKGKSAAQATGQSSTAYTENIKKMVEMKKRLSEVNSDLKKLTEFYNKGAGGDKITSEITKLVDEQNRLKLSIRDVTTGMNNQTKEITASKGSLVEMRAQLNQLNQLYDHLDQATREGSFGKNILSQIQQLDAGLKQAEGSTGRFQRNVGNYTSATTTLGKALNDVKNQIEEFTKSGKENAGVIDQLVKEEKLLQALLDNQAAGFASLAQEVKANEKALIDMKAAGLENSDAFKQMYEETAKAKDELQAFKKSLAARGDEGLFINAAAEAAQTLAGVYGIAQGAVALFGDENEELMKTMVKLQAVMTIVNGLQQISNVLKKESSLQTAINVGFQRIELAQTRLQTAAESKNIVVKYASIVAQKALNAVMALTPTGLLIAGLTAVGVAIVAFVSKTNQAEKAQKAFNLELENAIKLNDMQINAVKDSTDLIVAGLKSRYKTEKEIREAEIKGLDEQLRMAKALESAKEAQAEADRQRLRESKDSKEVERLQKSVEAFEQIQTKRQELEKSLEIARLNDAKATSDELIDIEKQTVNEKILSLNRQLDVSKKIIDNDEKTYQERKAALLKSANLEKQIAELQKQQVTNDPRTQQKDLIAAEQTYRDAILKIKQEAIEKNKALEKEEQKREKAAAFELAKVKIQASIDSNNDIVQNEESSSSDRLTALKKFYEENEKLIIAQRDFEIDNTTLLESEKVVIRKKAQNEILKNQKAFISQLYEISKQELLKQSKSFTDTQSEADSLAQVDLLQRIKKGLKTSNEFYSAFDKLKDKQISNQLEMEKASLEGQLIQNIRFGKDVTEIRSQIASKTLEIEQHQLSVEEKIMNERLGQLQKYSDMAMSVFSTIGDIANISNEKEKNRIQEQIDLLEKKKATEIAVAQASVGTEEEKAAKIKIIEARAQVDREALEMRQRQLDQKRARFEKALNIASIIQETALAVVRALGMRPWTPANIALAAGIGALGAAKLAVAIATPIPKYRHGTEDHKGGLAIVGDGGKREVIQTPTGDRYITPDKPTLVSMPRRSKVFPDADSILEGLKFSAFKELPVHNITDKNYANEMSKALSVKLDQITYAVKAKKETHFKITHAGMNMSQRTLNNYIQWVNKNMQS